MIQYAAAHPLYLIAAEYWMPAFAGMTAVLCARRWGYYQEAALPLPLAAHEIEIAAFVRLQDGFVEQMRVAAPGPFRCRRGGKRRAPFFQLGNVDQQIDASLGN